MTQKLLPRPGIIKGNKVQAIGNSITSATAAKHNAESEAILTRLRIHYSQFLEQALSEPIALELHYQSAPVTSEQFNLFNQSMPSVLTETDICRIFAQIDVAQSGTELLILGEPGSGKTVLLFKLAMALLERSQQHAHYPLPVIVNLSTWTNKHEPLKDWIIKEAASTYKLNPPTALRRLVEAGQILPILDGLDEVPLSVRAACMKAINTFQSQSKHTQSLVVCSRNNEYFDQPERLEFSVVTVQPLQEQQVMEYLEHIGEPIAEVQAALQSNIILKELLTTPLMFSTVILAYRDRPLNDLPRLGSAEDQQRQILDDYLQRMLEPERGSFPLPITQTKHWLAWLAQQMQKHNQIVFFIESLQPDWLSGKQKIFCHLSIGLVIGMVIGVIFGMVGGLIGGLASGLAGGLVGLLCGLLCGLLIGIIGEVVIGMVFRKNTMIRPAQTLSWSWSKARSSLTFGLLGTLLGVLLCGSILGLFIGLLVGQPFFGLLAGLLIGHIFGIIAVSFVGLIAGLIGGLSGKQLTEPLNLAPNEGIWRSAKNGLLVGLISGLISGPIVGLLIGLLVGLLVGLNAFFQHFTLRFWLQQANCMPWNCVAFLDEAAHRSLLYKSGGGYRFIHNLFRDYIASLETPSSGEQKE